MNERIKELVEQSGFKILTDGRIIPTLDHNGECGRDLQKFAELIVLECADFVDQNTLEDQGMWGKIVRHFGVEE